MHQQRKKSSYFLVLGYCIKKLCENKIEKGDFAVQTPHIIYNDKKPSTTALIAKRLAAKNADFMRHKTIEEHRETQNFIFSKLAVPKNISTQHVFCSNVKCEWIWQTDCELSSRVVLYLHGGSWAFGSLKTARAAGIKMAEALRCRVLTVDYRLSPENPFPAGLSDTYSVYIWLLKSGFKPSDIGLLGDSAGGNLALCLTTKLIQKEQPLPACIALISPATDLRTECAALSAKPDLLYTLHRGLDTDVFSMYVPKGIDRSNPLISPICGSLAGFPPILIHAGSDECLTEDIIAFANKAHSDNVDILLKLWVDLFHNFTLGSPIFPEAQESVVELADFLCSHLQMNTK